MWPMFEDLPRLHQAVVRRNVQEAFALLKAGYDPNEVDIGGNPAIIHAVRHFDTDSATTALVRILLAAGARADPLPGRVGVSALGMAVFQGLRECALCLIEGGADPNFVIQGDREKGGGDRCLHLLTEATPAAVVRVLLDAKADVHAVNGTGRTALHLTSASGNSAAVRLLLERGANPSCPSYDGSTPLHCAAEKGHYEIAEMLIRAGAPAGIVKQTTGTTPLHMAAQMCNISVLRLLLREGAPVDAVNRNWCTPLMTAAAHGYASAASVLVSAGASTEKRNALGMAALESVAVAHSDESSSSVKDTFSSDGEVNLLLIALFRSPGSNARASPWRWPPKSGGRRASAALAALKKRQQQRQQALREEGEAGPGAGSRGEVAGGGSGRAKGAANEGREKRETPGREGGG
ncbi:unnamed protein product, partial [Scytosiphon promiscuus]